MHSFMFLMIFLCVFFAVFGVILPARQKQNQEKKEQQLEMLKTFQPNLEPIKENNNIDKLLEYKELFDIGAITQEEFDQKKAELLK